MIKPMDGKVATLGGKSGIALRRIQGYWILPIDSATHQDFAVFPEITVLIFASFAIFIRLVTFALFVCEVFGIKKVTIIVMLLIPGIWIDDVKARCLFLA